MKEPFGELRTERANVPVRVVAVGCGYAKKRDAARRESLGGLFKKVNDAGLYDASYTGTNAG